MFRARISPVTGETAPHLVSLESNICVSAVAGTVGRRWADDEIGSVGTQRYWRCRCLAVRWDGSHLTQLSALQTGVVSGIAAKPPMPESHRTQDPPRATSRLRIPARTSCASWSPRLLRGSRSPPAEDDRTGSVQPARGLPKRGDTMPRSRISVPNPRDPKFPNAVGSPGICPGGECGGWDGPAMPLYLYLIPMNVC